MIVGILGILKAGGAYVPIDPDYPGDRIGYILSDTGTSWVLSSRESRSSIPENYPGRVIELDGQWEQISSYPSTPLQASIHPDQLIYVIYTSGSTGRPKGVMIEHRNVITVYYWTDFQKVAPPEGEDDVLDLGISCPYTFDVSVWEFFMEPSYMFWEYAWLLSLTHLQAFNPFVSSPICWHPRA